MVKPRTTCPDCDGRLEAVRLVGHVLNVVQGADVTLSYAPGQARPGVLTQRTRTKGYVFGMRCSDCGRVLVYAAPSG